MRANVLLSERSPCRWVALWLLQAAAGWDRYISSNQPGLSSLAGNEAGEKIDGLTVNALAWQSVVAKLDPRRQPMQPLPFISGNLPSEFLTAIPANRGVTGSGFIDEYLQPGSRGISPDIRNLVAVRRSAGSGRRWGPRPSGR